MAKQLYESRTLWFNTLTFAVAVLTHLSGMADQIPPAAMPWIIAALAIANFGLRLVTDKPVAIPGD